MINFKRISEVLCPPAPAEVRSLTAWKYQEHPGPGERFWLQLWAVVPAAWLGYLLLPNGASAQVIPDRSLPTEVVRNGNNFTINEGARAGGNLFHSFQEFSVPTGGEAFFNNQVDVDNIFSRVTGGRISDIDGLIRANGTANLFLLNPAGIVFGPNARLNIGGSFFGSTASGLMFPDGMEFNATEQTTPILTINAPIGLRFRESVEPITVQGLGQEFGLDGIASSFDSALGGLRVQPGRTLALVGGNLQLDGAILQAPGGQIELGGLATAGTVELAPDMSLIFSENIERADVSFTNKAGVNVIAGNDGGGSIAINARNIEVSGESLLSSGIASDLGDINTIAGDVGLNATGATAIENSRIENNVNLGNSGNIDIQTGSFSLTNSGELNASNFESGLAGKVTVDSQNKVAISQSSIFSNGSSGVVSLLSSNSAIDIDNSLISTKSNDNIESGVFSLVGINAPEGAITLNQATISTTNDGTGFAGDVVLRSRDEITIANRSNILSDGFFGRVLIESSNSSVNLNSDSLIRAVNNDDIRNTDQFSLVAITTPEGSITVNRAIISTSNEGVGFAGDILLEALEKISLLNESDIFSEGFLGRIFIGSAGESTESLLPRIVEIDNGTILSTTTSPTDFAPDGRGNAGSIQISASDSVLVSGGAQLNSSTLGEGNAGSVIINATETVSFDGSGNEEFSSGAFSTVATGAVGTGGSIEIKARLLSLTNGAILQTTTFGKAGEIGSDAGNIQIDVDDSVLVNDGSQILSDSFGEGNAGNITINAGNTVSLDGVLVDENGTTIRSTLVSSFVGRNTVQELVGTGKGGDIRINTGSLFVTDGADLDTSTIGEGNAANAGNIIIQASDLVSFDGASSNAFSVAGNVGIDFEVIGDGGNIDIEARVLSLTDGAELITQTFGSGKAGDIRVNVTDLVTISGVAPTPLDDNNPGGFSSGLIVSTEENATGSGGTIDIRAGTLRLSNGGVLSARSRSAGQGGNIIVNADDIELTGGGQILATAFSSGSAGSITVNAAGGIAISGSDPTFDSRFEQVGKAIENLQNAGNTNLLPVEFTIDPVNSNSGIFAGSTGTESTGSAGTINVRARSLELEDQGGISAEADAAEGGDIVLEVSDLILLRGGSQISTTAGSPGVGGDGGNITIKTDYLAASPDGNNDITANSFRGSGGRINITAQGVFGLRVLTPEEAAFDSQQLPTNDIAAISLNDPALSGQVEFNTPEIDLTQGLTELSENVIDTETIVARACPSDRPGKGSIFVIAGRGGLPPSPDDPLTDDTIRVQGKIIPAPTLADYPHTQQPPIQTEPTEPIDTNTIQPARGWYVNEKGVVVLTAEPIQPTFVRYVNPLEGCPGDRGR